MSTVNATNPKIDLTVRIFDEFYNFAIDVNPTEYDIVNSFFKSICATAEIAGRFTVTVFRIAQKTQTPVLTVLDSLRNRNTIELTSTLAYYLNGIQSPSTLLGITGPVVPNYYTARNVLL